MKHRYKHVSKESSNEYSGRDQTACDPGNVEKSEPPESPGSSLPQDSHTHDPMNYVVSGTQIPKKHVNKSFQPKAISPLALTSLFFFNIVLIGLLDIALRLPSKDNDTEVASTVQQRG